MLFFGKFVYKRITMKYNYVIQMLTTGRGKSMAKKNNLIALRIDDGLKEKLEELAFNNGNKTNLSDYIRDLLQENIDLIEKQKESINKYGFRGAMEEIYINMSYSYFDKIRTINEKITYSNQFINLLLEEVNDNEKTIYDLLSMAIIRHNINNCSKYSSDEDQKVYKLLKTLSKNLQVENIFIYEECKSIKSIEEDEKINQENAILKEIKPCEESEVLVKKLEYLKSQYLKVSTDLNELKDTLVSRQFDWDYYKLNEEYECVENIYKEIQECISKKNCIEKMILNIIKDAYCSESYKKWKEEYFSPNDLTIYGRLELKRLLYEKSHWELESELSFIDLINNLEFDIVFQI